MFQGHGWHFFMYNKTSSVDLFNKNGFTNIQIIPKGETRIGNAKGLDLHAHEHTSIYLETTN